MDQGSMNYIEGVYQDPSKKLIPIDVVNNGVKYQIQLMTMRGVVKNIDGSESDLIFFKRE